MCKYVTYLAIVALVAISPLVLSGCMGEKAQMPVVPEPTTGSLHIVSVLEMPDSMVAALPHGALQEMSNEGWVRTAQGFERYEDPTTFSVSSGAIVSTVKSDGSFEIADRNNYTLQFMSLPISMDRAPIQTTIAADGTVHMMAMLSVREHLMHNDHHGAGGHVPNGTLACLDYNGPYGNQKDNQWWGQAQTNFIGSDCAVAFSSCVFYDFTKSPICNGSFNCSSLISHCTGYHKHTYYGGPKC